MMCCVGFVLFVLTLKKDFYQIQFGMVSKERDREVGNSTISFSQTINEAKFFNTENKPDYHIPAQRAYSIVCFTVAVSSEKVVNIHMATNMK